MWLFEKSTLRFEYFTSSFTGCIGNDAVMLESGATGDETVSPWTGSGAAVLLDALLTFFPTETPSSFSTLSCKIILDILSKFVCFTQFLSLLNPNGQCALFQYVH